MTFVVPNRVITFEECERIDIKIFKRKMSVVIEHKDHNRMSNLNVSDLSTCISSVVLAYNFVQYPRVVSCVFSCIKIRIFKITLPVL